MSLFFSKPGVKAYTGLWASGKTLAMAEECEFHQKRGVKVYTNFGFHGETAPLESFEDLLRLCACETRERRHIAMDELGMLLPARGYRDWPPALNVIFLQGRKFGISFSYSVQDFELVDSNVRRVTSLVCKCRGHGRVKLPPESLERYRPWIFSRSWYLGEVATSKRASRLGISFRTIPKNAAELYDTHAFISVAQRMLSAQAEALASRPSVVVVAGD